MDEAQVENSTESQIQEEMYVEKSTLSWTLTGIMLFVYVGFMFACWLQQKFLLSSISGGVTTWGVPLGIGIIILSFILCWVYSYIAHNKLDQLNREAIQEVEAITKKGATLR